MRERGSATVEHAGLAALIAALVIASVSAIAASPPERGGRELAGAIARKLRCAPRAPGPCWRDPLTEAYGRGLAGAVRALAPAPLARAGAGGEALLPVDFRRCRRASCAAPGAREGLTASNRRVSAFTSVERRADGSVAIDYWLYRPTLGWERRRSVADAGRVAALGATPLLEADVPALVPLETLAGRNHVPFAPTEEPPWRWRVGSVHPP